MMAQNEMKSDERSAKTGSLPRKNAPGMEDELREKVALLRRGIEEKGSLLVAFSGGVDSSVVSKVAYDVLGDDCLAVTLASDTFSADEREIARRIAKEIGIRHEVVTSSELTNEDFLRNPEDRCYYCKREEVLVLKNIAEENGLARVADGVTLSDYDEHRPGIVAMDEMGVVHPLVDAGIKKSEIWKIARYLSLSNYDMASTTCLASRIPYGREITPAKLQRIETSESFIRSLGFRQVRVRHHGKLARIEVDGEEIGKLVSLREPVHGRLKEEGFDYVTLDLKGYRSGSMNEILPRKEQEREEGEE